MKILIQYELKKIMRKKSTLIVLIVSLFATAFLFYLPVIQYHSYTADGVIKGSEGIAHEKSQFQDLTVPMTEEYIEDTILQYQELFSDPANVGNNGFERFLIGDAYWNFAAPRTKLLTTIARTYDHPTEDTGFDKLPVLDMTGGADFYETRNKKIEDLLDEPSRELSEAQKAFWTDWNSGVRTPFPYGYYEVWEILLNSFELLTFALLAICIVTAPVFSGEYQAGTAALLLSGTYGKTKLVNAKIAASLLIGVFVFTLHVVLAMGIPLLAFGTDGWDLPVQIADTTIPYPFTFLQALLLQIGVLYLILLGLLGLTIFLSARLKSPYLVLTILVPIVFLPLFLASNSTTGLYNLILFLLPYRATVPELNKYISYQFGGIVLDTFSMRAIVYALLLAVTLPFARRGFRKHQITG